MKDNMRILTAQDVLNIEDCPMAVLSDNLGSPVAGAIKGHTRGAYNHFMWLIEPGTFCSQDLTFKRVAAGEYLKGAHRLKFWTNPSWKPNQREAIIAALKKDLDKPWYRKLYDWPAIIGQALNWRWLQVPGIDICSDKARLLALVDFRYDLENPDPQDVNAWLERTYGYEVYGRYIPD